MPIGVPRDPNYQKNIHIAHMPLKNAAAASAALSNKKQFIELPGTGGS